MSAFASGFLPRLAVIALTAGVALATLPAQAAPSLGTTLQLEAPAAPQADGDGAATMMMKKGGEQSYDYDDEDCDDWGLTNKQIRRGLHYAGFGEIDFVKELKHHRVRVEALYEEDGWVYSMRIDRCDGDVDQIKPLYEYDDFDIEF
jgi:hypothetical protein